MSALILAALAAAAGAMAGRATSKPKTSPAIQAAPIEVAGGRWDGLEGEALTIRDPVLLVTVTADGECAIRTGAGRAETAALLRRIAGELENEKEHRE